MLFTEWKLEEAQQIWLEEGIEIGIDKGRAEGIEIGIDKGREEERLEMALAMFAEGDSLEKIARVTKKPLELLKEKLRVQ